jgi:hypothetical protein
MVREPARAVRLSRTGGAFLMNMHHDEFGDHQMRNEVVEYQARRRLAWEPSRVAVGFRNSATGLDLGFYAARSYSLRRPPRTGLRLIRFWERSATGKSGRGGRSWRLR